MRSVKSRSERGEARSGGMRDSNSREAPKVASAERDRTHTPKFKITQQKAAAVVREREKERTCSKRTSVESRNAKIAKCELRSIFRKK